MHVWRCWCGDVVPWCCGAGWCRALTVFWRCRRRSEIHEEISIVKDGVHEYRVTRDILREVEHVAEELSAFENPLYEQ